MPTRPRPVWISSAMKRTLCFVQISRAFFRKPSGGMRMPASAWMGSTRKAAVFGVIALSRASASPKGMTGKPGREGPEVLAVKGLGGEADDGHRPAVEVVGAGDDLGPVLGHALLLVAPLAGRLDGRLHGLGPRVHRQDHLVAGQLAELLGQERPLVVAEGPRGQRQLLGLVRQGLDDPGMAVALVDGRIGAQEIQVLPALDVVHPDALGLGDDDVQGVVVVGPVQVLDGDEVLAVHAVPPSPARGWRRGRDSNPRYGLRAHTLSKRAP